MSNIPGPGQIRAFTLYPQPNSRTNLPNNLARNLEDPLRERFITLNDPNSDIATYITAAHNQGDTFTSAANNDDERHV